MPRGASKEVVSKLNAAVVEALADSAVRSRFIDLRFEVFPPESQSPEGLGALVKADVEKWWPIIKQSGIKPQ
jgi:tripartite-type tricarboxylate transporter receptor subunit TctC